MNPLVGCWRLVSFTEARADGAPFDVFGATPKGYIAYHESGHMSVVFGAAERRVFRGAWNEVADGDKAANYDSIVAYAGRYTLHPDRVVHHVEVCWIPNWEGRDLIRYLTFLPEDRLLLRTPRERFGRPQPVQDVIVERARGNP